MFEPQPLKSPKPTHSHKRLESDANSFALQNFDFAERGRSRKVEAPRPMTMHPVERSRTSRAPSIAAKKQPSRAQSVHSMRGGSPMMSEHPPLPHASESYTSENSGLMLKYIARQAGLMGWFDVNAGQNNAEDCSMNCIAIKPIDGEYVFEPVNADMELEDAVFRLDECVVMTMTSEITSSILAMTSPGQKSITVEHTGARIPVLASLKDVSSALGHSSRACIIQKEGLILIWGEDPGAIINIGNDVEKQLLGMLFSSKAFSETTMRPPMSGNWSPREGSFRSEKYNAPMSTTSEALVRGALDEKNEVYSKAVALEEAEEGDQEDLEAALPPRPEARVHSIKVSIAIMLVILSQTLGISKILNEFMWDGGYMRFGLIATIPPLALFSLFFFIVLVASFFQLLLPLGNCLKNTKFHSATKPNPARYKNYELPHITIQMPVYKEGLRGVIVPTMISLMAAVEHYEQLGGTASVFINDDGMQCIDPELAEARRQYYRENGIGFTARLPHSKAKPPKRSWFGKSKPIVEDKNQDNSDLTPQQLSNKINFLRKGKFKKASNMNYGLDFSNRVEDELRRLTDLEVSQRGISQEEMTVEDDDRLYETALNNMLDADDGRTWAEGNIRIGELILIIDCDTRVPVDCLLYGALELHESPEVAILQHGSGVMQVVNNMFENGITYFTNIVYTAIKYGVGTGDVAPFVGHNAFLRWKALQSIAFVDPIDGQNKWWSDAHVSEDFDISLRLQMQGWVVRLATYHNGGFKEGVSLTVYDELTRWEKYAYGCNELVFHPFYQWPYRGPVTRLFLRFLWSNMPVTSKVTIIAYIFTYYAIGSGLLLATVNYVIIGLFPDELDHYYLPSWGIWLSLVVVFNGFSSIAFSMLRHQMKEEQFWLALLKAIKWLPFLILFFGGISINCAKALLCHAFSINIEWASTAKEMGPTGFYIGMDKMVKSFKWTWIICIFLSAVMVYMSVGAPWGWNITPGEHSTAFIAIFPLAIQIGSAFFLPLGLGLN